MSIRHKEQRVGVFVDVSNMYHTAKHLFNANVNYGKILEEAVSERKLIRAVAYVVRSQNNEEEPFFEALNNQGYEVKAKDLQVFIGGAKKGDWDVGIAMDIMRMASKLDVIVLASGDGDFTELLKHAKALGCRTEVAAFGKSASAKLIDEADSFIDLNEQKAKFLIVKGKHSALPRRNISMPTRPAQSAPISSASRIISARPVRRTIPRAIPRQIPRNPIAR
ncbi:MAG: NYN domain-containing protein [Patescibacteria group bacterium]